MMTGWRPAKRHYGDSCGHLVCWGITSVNPAWHRPARCPRVNEAGRNVATRRTSNAQETRDSLRRSGARDADGRAGQNLLLDLARIAGRPGLDLFPRRGKAVG